MDFWFLLKSAWSGEIGCQTGLYSNSEGVDKETLIL